MSSRRAARGVPARVSSEVPAELFDRMHPRWWPNGLMGTGPDSPGVLASASGVPVRPISVRCQREASRAWREFQREWCAAHDMLDAKGQVDWRRFGLLARAAGAVTAR